MGAEIRKEPGSKGGVGGWGGEGRVPPRVPKRAWMPESAAVAEWLRLHPGSSLCAILEEAGLPLVTDPTRSVEHAALATPPGGLGREPRSSLGHSLPTPPCLTALLSHCWVTQPSPIAADPRAAGSSGGSWGQALRTTRLLPARSP